MPEKSGDRRGELNTLSNLLYWVIHSGPLLYMHLSSLSLNLCELLAFTASFGSKCPKPIITEQTTISSFILHQVPVSCIYRLLVLVMEETVAPSLCAVMILYIHIISIYSFLYLFRGMILVCLFLQLKLWEPSPYSILHNNLPWTSPYNRTSF